MYIFFYSPPPPGSGILGHLTLVFFVSLSLSKKTLTFALTYGNFWNMRDRDFIFAMRTLLLTLFQMTLMVMTMWPRYVAQKLSSLTSLLSVTQWHQRHPVIQKNTLKLSHRMYKLPMIRKNNQSSKDSTSPMSETCKIRTGQVKFEDRKPDCRN